MNCNILKKEFLELEISIQEYTNTEPTWLEDFFERPLLSEEGVGGGNSFSTTSPFGHLAPAERRGGKQKTYENKKRRQC